MSVQKNMKQVSELGYITPLFWQHGEQEEVLRREISKMDESGMQGFIIESRPHPDYLSYGWWRDLDIILDEAEKRNMNVWIFDDGAFPSGYGGGKLKKLYPEALKVYLKECHIDAVGPLKGSSFLIKSWVSEGEEVVRIVAARRRDMHEELYDESFCDLTEYCEDGILYWDVPEGEWRVFIFLKTREGGEDVTKDYVNPIDYDAVGKFIEVIYEEHYKRYKDKFGSVIKGFFVDEPRFGNEPAYDLKLAEYSECKGIPARVLPYSDGLPAVLNAELGEDFGKYLPYLWCGTSEKSQDIRYTYMNVVSKLFGKNFLGQMGEWCRNHGVKMIGHIVEDNGAHARLGYGCGHFFRAMEGMDLSGLDVVYQVWPEQLEGRHQSPFGYLDSRFYYWGIAKMASSLAAIDKKKGGRTVCEVFGAYGWQEGLKLMKWLTDHICVRGVNFLIPHAFSPKYPDADCPPHFYAGGNNPQWEYFPVWSAYANRLCDLLTGGKTEVQAAVLYHAEAEWGGEYEPFEKAVQTLMGHQINCHVIPLDYLSKERSAIENSCLKINGNSYRTLIIPYGSVWPEELFAAVKEMAEKGVRVCFMGDLPKRCYYLTKKESQWETLRELPQVWITDYEKLPMILQEEGCDILAADSTPYLVCTHLKKQEGDIYFFVNQSKYKSIRTKITVNGEKSLALYDALEDRKFCLKTDHISGRTEFMLELTPYQSVFVLENREENLPVRVWENPNDRGTVLEGEWKVRIGGREQEEKIFSLKTLENLARPGILPGYSGVFYYEKDFKAEKQEGGQEVYLDLGEVYETAEVFLNDVSQGVRICPPYRVKLSEIREGNNHLQIKVVNTLAKEKGDNWLDRGMPQEPSGLLGPVSLIGLQSEKTR